MKLDIQHNWWRVCLLSAISGLILGCAAEFLRRAYNNYQAQLVIEKFEGRGMSPPLMVDNLHWWALPVWTTVIFLIGGFLIYGLWFNRLGRKNVG